MQRRTGDIGDKLEVLSYCAKDEQSICGHVAIQLLLGSPCPCGLLQGTVLGLDRRSAGAETHCLPLLLSSMFPLFSVLAEYFASSHDLFFLRVAAGCHTSAAGGENHKEKQALLFSELRGPALKILTRVLPEHKLSDFSVAKINKC